MGHDRPRLKKGKVPAFEDVSQITLGGYAMKSALGDKIDFTKIQVVSEQRVCLGPECGKIIPARPYQASTARACSAVCAAALFHQEHPNWNKSGPKDEV